MHLELKYDNDSEKLEESKEEETPLNQIAKILEKNGECLYYTQLHLFIIFFFFKHIIQLFFSS